MIELTDQELVSRYARDKSEEVFATLVARHVNLVYSTALRFTGSPTHAEEITQAVFIVLARKAGSLRSDAVLAGWLYQTARFTTANFLKGEIRRQRREQEAFMLSSLNDSTSAAWEQIAPLLDEAMRHLGATDHNVIVLRFFENKSAHEVASTLQLTEAAAHKRISRALEKLRKFFARRGILLPVAVIAAAVAANSVQAAPASLAGMVKTIAIRAAKGAAVAASIAVSVKLALKQMAWAKYKGLIGFATVSLIALGTVVALNSANQPTQSTPPSVLATPARPISVASAAVLETLTPTTLLSLGVPAGGLAVQPDGKIIVGTHLSGFFVDPQSLRMGLWKRGVVRLLPDGTIDRTFHSQVEGDASDAHRAHVNVQPDGRLIISGLFESLDGSPLPGYARLLPDGRLDKSFLPWQGSTNLPARTYLPGGVYPAALLGDGLIAVLNNSIEGPRAPYPLTVYRLATSGALIPPTPGQLASTLFPRPTGLILTLGPIGFWARKPIDWTRSTPANRREFHFPPGQAPPVADLPFEACIEPPSIADAAPVFRALFEEVPVELCRYAAQLPDGGTILAIRDKAIDGSQSAPGRFMRFDKNWQPDFSFTNHYEADLTSCMTIRRQTNGKYLVAGLVGKMNGQDFPGLLRLNEDGSVDDSFHCETDASWHGRVMDFAVQADEHIIICGFFDTVNGVKCPHLARLNPDGSLDETFNSPFLSLEKFNAIRFPVHQLAENPEAPTVQNPGPPRSTTSPADTILIISMSSQDNAFAIRFTGSPNKAYILQATDTAAAPDWKNVSTNRTDASGGGTFRDADATGHPMRFYRVATPQ